MSARHIWPSQLLPPETTFITMEALHHTGSTAQLVAHLTANRGFESQFDLIIR